MTRTLPSPVLSRREGAGRLGCMPPGSSASTSSAGRAAALSRGSTWPWAKQHPEVQTLTLASNTQGLPRKATGGSQDTAPAVGAGPAAWAFRCLLRQPWLRVQRELPVLGQGLCTKQSGVSSSARVLWRPRGPCSWGQRQAVHYCPLVGRRGSRGQANCSLGAPPPRGPSPCPEAEAARQQGT